jgi:hypothetical protein
MIMSEPSRSDKIFYIIMKRMVETGVAPHYTEIAAELVVPPEDGKKALQDLFSTPMFPGW